MVLNVHADWDELADTSKDHKHTDSKIHKTAVEAGQLIGLDRENGSLEKLVAYKISEGSIARVRLGGMCARREVGGREKLDSVDV